MTDEGGTQSALAFMVRCVEDSLSYLIFHISPFDTQPT
jgi:hypothetical protein